MTATHNNRWRHVYFSRLYQIWHISFCFCQTGILHSLLRSDMLSLLQSDLNNHWNAVSQQTLKFKTHTCGVITGLCSVLSHGDDKTIHALGEPMTKEMNWLKLLIKTDSLFFIGCLKVLNPVFSLWFKMGNWILWLFGWIFARIKKALLFFMTYLLDSRKLEIQFWFVGGIADKFASTFRL